MTEHPAINQQLKDLLRLAATIDIVGEVNLTVTDPVLLIACTHTLTRPVIVAWRSTDSGARFVQVTAHHAVAPVHGAITVVLSADPHLQFWHTLLDGDLTPGEERTLDPNQLTVAAAG